MAPRVNYISDLVPGKINWTLEVRVIRLWTLPEHKNPLNPNSIEMLLLDKKLDRIHCTVKTSLIPMFQSVLKEGHAYRIDKLIVNSNDTKFATTASKYKIAFMTISSCRPLKTTDIPMNHFSFATFPDILAAPKDELIIDVIGHIVEKSELKEQRSETSFHKLINLVLEDLESNRVQCTLWSDFAEQVAADINESSSSSAPIIILQLCKLKKYQGVCPQVTVITSSSPEIGVTPFRSANVDGTPQSGCHSFNPRIHQPTVNPHKQTAKSYDHIVSGLQFSTNSTPVLHDNEITLAIDTSLFSSIAVVQNAPALNHTNSKIPPSTAAIEVPYWDIGDAKYIYQFCGALMWFEERVQKKYKARFPRFSLCCRQGRVTLPLYDRPPAVLYDLFHNRDRRGRFFLANIRSFNSMFAFTSMGGKIHTKINDGRGPPIFVLNGENYHQIGSLLPDADREPKFAQLYIHDTENEVSNRMSVVRMEEDDLNLRAQIVMDIKDCLDSCNPFVKTYRVARDMLSENKGMRVFW